MINIREANIQDSEDIYIWRNDSLTREMSLHSGFIEWEEHSKWLDTSLNDLKVLLLICELVDPKVKLAVVRFNIQKDRADVSINLSPNERGKGFSKKCLERSINYFTCNNPDVVSLVAKIKLHNEASRNIFEALGFIYKKEFEDITYYEYLI